MKTKQIALNSIFIAMIIVMSVVPNMGFITIGGIGITLIHIPVLIVALYAGYQSAFIAGLTFGLGSLFVALTRPMTPLDLVFQNPLVSVLPRVLFALITVFVFNLINNKGYTKSALAISAFIGTISHTFLVLLMFYIFGGMMSGGLLNNIQAFYLFVAPIILVNGVVEALTAVLIVPAVVIAIKTQFRR